MWTNAPSEHISVKFDSKCCSFHWRKREFRHFVNKILVIVSQKGNYLGFCSCSSPNIPVDMSVKVCNTKVAATGCQNDEADEAPDDHDGVKGTAKVKHSIQWHCVMVTHDDVIKWKHFPRYWPFVRGIHRPPVNSPHKGQWRGALLFFFICV